MSSVHTFGPLSPDVAVVPTGEPCWDVALLFPERGSWTEADYLALDTSRLVELSDGSIEVLPVADWAHQFIVGYFYRVLDAFVVARHLGQVAFAPLPVRLWPDKMREPDVVFVRSDRARSRKFAEGADLVVEVVSEGEENRRRDLVDKRAEYAKAGISEYWIVDPQSQQITVLSLDLPVSGQCDSGDEYREHGVFATGEVASSKLLEGFSVAVADVFAAAKR